MFDFESFDWRLVVYYLAKADKSFDWRLVVYYLSKADNQISFLRFN